MGVVAIFVLIGGTLLLLQGTPGGWCLLAFGIPLIAACGIGVRDRHPRLIMSDEGLYVRSLGEGAIPWAQIQAAREKRIPRSGSVIILSLYDGTSRQFDVTWLEQKPPVILRQINARIGQVTKSTLLQCSDESEPRRTDFV